MFIGVDHVGYLVRDLEAAIAAYQAFYGGEVELRMYNEVTKTKIAFVKSGETRVELMEPDDKASLPAGQAQVIHHVGYLVPDILKAGEELRAKGARFLTEAPTKNKLGRQIWYFDGGPVLGARQHISQH